ncbi:PEP-CTERM sorting domain-containing protein [Neptunomonas japonica]|uniref:PEP-CTERM sorting domain-containing protein n=1 Tax=Neptunomonas japonica TaxID=417574 RepID=UPI0003FDDB4C|nr:PEP-CTERM sorting domain-containing protein [Neptunomonas japonica]
MRNNYFQALGFIAAIGVSVNANAALIGQWDFNGSVAGTPGNDAVLSAPTGLDTSGYNFDSGNGVAINVAGITDTYAIEMQFSLDSNDSGYQRLISFDGIAEDYGLYAYDNYIYFYDASPDIDNFTFSAGEAMTLKVSRDGSTDTFSAYLNDNFLWDFDDSSNLAVITDPSQMLNFFVDDGSENPSGFVDSIKVFDGNDNASTVPVPATMYLFLTGLLGLMRLRKKTREHS